MTPVSIQNFFHSSSKSLEDLSFPSLKLQLEQKIITIYSLALGLLTFTMVLFDLSSEASLLPMVYKLILPVLLIGGFLAHRKFLIGQKLALIIATAIISHLITSNISMVGNSSYQHVFINGNLVSLFELCLLFSLSNIYERLFACFGFFAVKYFALEEDTFGTSNRFGLLLLPLLFAALISSIYEALRNYTTMDILDQAKNFEQFLSNGLPSSLVIIHPEHDRILYVNNSLTKSFLSKEDEKAENTLKNMWIVSDPFDQHAKQQQQIEVSLYDFIKEKSSDLATLNVHYKNEKSTLPFEAKISKVTWNGESVYSVLLNGPQKQQEPIQEKLLKTISHEVKTCMDSITGLLKQAATRITDTQTLTYLENCRSCTRFPSSFINSILSINSPRSKTKDVVILEKYLEEIKTFYAYSAQQKGINFVVDKSPQLPRQIYTSQQKLTGILIILLSNAFKFTSKGAVTLRVYPDRQTPGKVIFSVEDTGVGIDGNEKTKLTKIFSGGNGTNYEAPLSGLSLACKLMEALGGDSEENSSSRIEFDSAYNKGSTFWFKIDVLCPQPKSASLQNEMTGIFNDSMVFQETSLHSMQSPDINVKRYASIKYNDNLTKLRTTSTFPTCTNLFMSPQKQLETQETAPPSKRVLIVDDFPLNLMAASFVLEKLGYQTAKAFSGVEGLEVLKNSQESGNKFCMVLTDIQMPTMDGLEMSKEITRMISKGEMYNLPIVSITAKKMDDKERALHKQCGISYSLEKPLVKEEIKSIMENLGV